MLIEQREIDQRLTGLRLEVRKAVESRLHLVSSVEALSDLIAAAELDENLAPLVARARSHDEEGRKAFDDLWTEIAPYLKSTIRVWIRCKTPEHIEAVKALVMEALWLGLEDYRRERGFFFTWARTFARNQALWYKCRPLGAEPPLLDPSAEDVHQLPPSACFSEMLDMVQEHDPCRAIAFLWNKYLDWKPSAVAAAYGDTPLPELVAAIQMEMISRYPILVRVKAALAKLLKKAQSSPRRTLRDCAGSDDLVESITHWSNDAKRSLGSEVIGQAKKFLKYACELRVGAHETLSFLWNRLLRRKILELHALANRLLLDLLEMFREDYPGKNDLERDEILACTKPLELRMPPAKRLADCSREDLCADLVAWRDRVQAILLDAARERRMLALSYLCGCLPGIEGPARKGV